MSGAAFFTLDLNYIARDNRHNNVSDNATLAATIVKIFPDLHIDSHLPIFAARAS
jgi:hypothetical protein